MKTPSLAALIALLSLSAALPGVASAQGQGAEAGPDKIRQVIVYGEDPCPSSSEGGEITVCARLPDKERYRIPKELRDDPNSPQLQSWMNRAESIEYVGRAGTDSCSPVGAGGATGCFQKLARNARAERKALLGDASWADLVAAEREKRLSTIDAESADIEKRVQAEEAAAQGNRSVPVEGSSSTGATPYP